MPITSLTVKYRPVRVGFLVRQGQLDDLIKAAELNTLLWGGVYNPIIPIARIGEDNSPAERLIELFRPDTLYKVADAEEVNEFIAQRPFLRDPGHYGERLIYQDWRSKRNNVAYLDVLNLMVKLWQKEFKSVPPDIKGNCALVKWDRADLLDAVFTLVFGRFPKDFNLKDDFEHAFLNALRAQEIRVEPEAEVGKQLGVTISPLRLTGTEITKYGGHWTDPPGLFVGRAESLPDLLAFWNLRAAGNDLVFCPLDHVERVRPFIKSFLEWCDELPDSRSGARNRISITYTCSDEEVSTVIGTFPTKKPKSLWKHSPVIWNGLNVVPTHNCFDWQQGTGTIERSFDRYVLTIALPEKRFLRDVQEERPECQEQLLAASIDPFGDLGYPDHTLKLPDLPDLNEFYSREVCFDPWKLRVEPDGFALLMRVSSESETVYPVSHEKLVERVLSYADIRNDISQPGRLAAKIISGMREHMPLEACRVFKIRGVRRLIKALRPPTAKSWSQATKIIWDSGGFKKFEDLYIESRKSRKLKTSDAFTFLVKKGVIRPRLRWLERLLRRRTIVRCSSCGLQNVVPVREFESDQWTCDFCSTSQNLRPLIVTNFRNTPKMWGYKRGGLFTKDNNQEGAIPTILALLTFARIFDSNNLFYSTARALKMQGYPPCEVDFLVFTHRHRRALEIAIGEAKDEFGEIDERDIENLSAVRERLAAKGLSCYLAFAKTADAFSESELQAFRKLREQAIPFLLFTNKDLEPYHPYWEGDDEETLPHKYALTMQEMAENGYFRYLKRYDVKVSSSSKVGI